jgi:hypothetical protein
MTAPASPRRSRRRDPFRRPPGARAVARRRFRLAALVAVALAAARLPIAAQMPDVRAMSGVPLPSSDLPAGTITVRLVRGSLANNVAGHPVELVEPATGRARATRTDASGRARFDGLPPGARVRARTTIDGERLESEEFVVPQSGGVRLVLVAGASASSGAPPSSGAVPRAALSIGGESRVVIEMADEAVEVFYLLELRHGGSAPLDGSALVLDLPPGAAGATLLEGSTPQAAAGGSRVTVNGPFQPGVTLVQVGYRLPADGRTLRLAQRFPVAFERPVVVVEKIDGLRVASPQVPTFQEMQAEGRAFLVGAGAPIPAGGTLEVRLEGLPRHAVWPRYLALALALAVLVAGGWAAATAGGSAPAARARELEARREALFAELAALERASAPESDPGRLARRREIVAELERIYRELGAQAA